MNTRLARKLFVTTLAVLSIMTASIPVGALPTAYAAAGENIVPNPSLEQAAALNQSKPDQWGKGRWGTNTAVFTYPVPGYQSDKAARVDLIKRTSGDAKWYFKPIDIQPGSAYVFSDYAKSNVSQYITAEYELSDGSKIYKDLATPGPSSDWQRNEVTFTTPVNVRKISMFHLINKVGNLIIDNFEIRKAGDAPIPSVAPTPIPSPSPSTSPSTSPSPVPSASPSPVPSPSTSPSATFDEGLVSFTFDDNWKSIRDTAMPMLDAKGYKGTLYLISSVLEGGYSNYMLASDALGIQRRGHEIGSHSRTHTDLTAISSALLRDEVAGSLTELENLGFTAIKSFAYPYGSYNTEVKQAIKDAGYESARSTDDGLNSKTETDPYILRQEGLLASTPVSQVKEWIDDALRNKTWLILTIHRIDTGGDQYRTSPGDLRQIIDYVSSKNARVVTISQGMQLLSK